MATLPRRSDRRQSNVPSSEQSNDVNVKVEDSSTIALGSKVKKFFEGYGWYNGNVVSFDEKHGYYLVLYDDGDQEEFTHAELYPLLVTGEQRDEIMHESPSKDRDNSTDLTFQDAKTKTLPDMKATPRKPISKKRKTVVVTPSPTKTKSEQVKLPSARNIAFRGLPRGALARCPSSGFMIRALESVSPLETPCAKTAFLHRKGKSKSGVDPSMELPCRLLVVATADEWFPLDFVGKTFSNARNLHDALRGRAATTGAQFHMLATYELEAVADPPFAPWEFTKARLVSGGMLGSAVEKDSKDSTSEDIIVVQLGWDGGANISGIVSHYGDVSNGKTDHDMVWTVIESDEKELPAVLLGAPSALVGEQEAQVDSENVQGAEEVREGDGDVGPVRAGSDGEFLPPLSTKNDKIRLPASLLQKAMRRGSMLSSPAPLLEACSKLLWANKDYVRGSTLAALRAIWGCMLVDVAPFDDGEGCLGLPALLLLSLVAKADPGWTLPLPLLKATVSSSLRTAGTFACQPWIGFVERNDGWWKLERVGRGASSMSTQKALNLRNIIRASQCVVGGRLAWGRWDKFVGDTSAAAAVAYLNHQDWQGSHLPPPPAPSKDEGNVVEAFMCGQLPDPPSDKRVEILDSECRLAAVEPAIVPYTLVLLQSLLGSPPTRWKKHSLPALAKQVRKLITEANPRIRERVQLARLATWGKEGQTSSQQSSEQIKERGLVSVFDSQYKSFREVVSPTGTLSDKEIEIIDCFESIQRLQIEKGGRESVSDQAPLETPSEGGFCRVQAGPPLNQFDGRVAFILAFGSAIEMEVSPDPHCPSKKEVVSAMFCGDADEPLLVQRIGKARKEGKDLATSGGATSGAMAVPSLGYVQRQRSEEERLILEATELMVDRYWKGGVTTPLPLPPVGIQWEVPGDEDSVTRTAEFVDTGSGKKAWQFAIAGTKVDAFDARPVISPCALDLDDEDHKPVLLSSVPERQAILRTAFYVGQSGENFSGEVVLKAMTTLHEIAESDRTATGLSEGIVYDWILLAANSPLPSRTWRDVLLAIRTREKEHVVLGRGICPDGTGTPRDMTEGVLLRLFHALEMLYPAVLRKEGAMKFRVRPRGAAYHHMLLCLEKLGTGDLPPQAATSACIAEQQKRKCEQIPRTNKRPRRSAALASEEATRQMSLEISDSSNWILKKSKGDSDDEASPVEEKEYLPVPEITTSLWPHQEASVTKVVDGVKEGRRGHADASAVGAGKTLTALAVIVRLAEWIAATGQTRYGVLVMLPTKALIREWLLEIATHTKGFHVIEQREDGTLFSLTYARSHPPIDANSIIITTLDRVCRHPFVRQMAWDFVVVDECLSVQNAAAKRNPSAWRQIEASKCGCLMLSATFFRSQYDQLFYMIRMLRSPLPPTLPWLPATIHEHIVCQVPETDRSWTMTGEMVSLSATDLQKYRKIVESFRRKQINEPGGVDGRKLWVDLESFLRVAYEGRASKSTYRRNSVMSDAFASVAKALLRKGKRPLIFADTAPEADFLLRALRECGLNVCTWATVASQEMTDSSKCKDSSKRVIIAVKTVEGQGINMQHHADVILCRPTPGDHLEQMKGRVDRPGQATKDLQLIVLVAEHTIEEAKFANIRLAGNFFREYIAPVATKYREKIDLEATLAVCGTTKLKKGTVSGTWKRSLEAAGQSGAFAQLDDVTVATCTTSSTTVSFDTGSMRFDDDEDSKEDENTGGEKSEEPKYKPLNKVIRNKGDPAAVRQAKALAKRGFASLAVRKWLYAPNKPANLAVGHQRKQGDPKLLPKESPLRFSDATPPLVLDRETVNKAVTHLSQTDPKLAALIARVGTDALVNDCGTPRAPTQARLFDRCLRAITFTMVSVDAGSSFLRRLAIKIGVCLERKKERGKLLKTIFDAIKESGDDRCATSPDHLMGLLLGGHHESLTFTVEMLRELVKDCEIIKGKRTGYPHLCGVTYPCGKNDDHNAFLVKARAALDGDDEPVSAGFSSTKASFIVSLVDDFESGKISGEKMAKASDREAAKMLIGLKGIGEWGAGGVLMYFLHRADIMLYGDLTVRNYLNDLYDINHHSESETLLESAADFADNATNRNLIDQIAEAKGWSPYRSVVCFLMYHLQEENLVLL